MLEKIFCLPFLTTNLNTVKEFPFLDQAWISQLWLLSAWICAYEEMSLYKVVIL